MNPNSKAASAFVVPREQFPVCPGCHQNDRVDHESLYASRFNGVRLIRPMDPANPREWWCGRCNGWHSALPVRLAGSDNPV